MMLKPPKVWFIFDQEKKHVGQYITAEPPTPTKKEPYIVEGDAALIWENPKLVDGKVVAGDMVANQ